MIKETWVNLKINNRVPPFSPYLSLWFCGPDLWAAAAIHCGAYPTGLLKTVGCPSQRVSFFILFSFFVIVVIFFFLSCFFFIWPVVKFRTLSRCARRFFGKLFHDVGSHHATTATKTAVRSAFPAEYNSDSNNNKTKAGPQELG